MKRVLTILSVPVLALIVSSVVSAQSSQSDPRIGTWTLNVAKSKGTTRKSETRTYTQSDDSVTLHAEIVNDDGSSQVYGYTAKSDGKDYPLTGQAPEGADAISLKHVGNTITAETKKDGKVLITTKATFSADGKVMSLTSKGTGANGKPINSVRVFNKQ
jgi:hypothetical protein